MPDKNSAQCLKAELYINIYLFIYIYIFIYFQVEIHNNDITLQICFESTEVLSPQVLTHK